MATFEYKREQLKPSAMVTELDVLGALEWELVQIERLPTGLFAIMKKTTVV